MKKDKLLLDRIKKDIKKAKVISFDIFDTLLVRPYIRPIDLFDHLEKVYERPGFASERRDAERRVHIIYEDFEDITFDMIYDEIDDEFKDMKQKEMDWEEMVLRVNPELKQVYDYAQALGKKIIIASDMYFSTEFLSKVLCSQGIAGWDKIYVSGDINMTKRIGSMYEKILQDIDAIPSEILHIGDNAISDQKIPQTFGIKTVLYKQVVAQYKDNNQAVKMFIDTTAKGIGKSILISMMAYQYIKDKCKTETVENRWSYLGYCYTGPLAYGFAKFLEKQAIEDGIDHLLFIARDGYPLKKVFEQLQSGIKTSYVYANRKLKHQCFLDTDSNPLYMAYTLEYCSGKSDEVKDLVQQTTFKAPKDYHKFFKKYSDKLEPLLEDNRKNYERYIKSIVKPREHIAIVDSMANSFSAQKLINMGLATNVTGYYWAYTKQNWGKDLSCKSFAEMEYPITSLRRSNPKIFTKQWEIMEYFFASEELGVENLDEQGQPVYKKDASKQDITRAANYHWVMEEALSFTNEICKLFHNHDCFFNFSMLTSWVNCFISMPGSIYKDFFSNYPVFFNIKQDTPTVILTAKVPFFSYLFHEKKVKELLKKSLWKTTFQEWYLKNWGIVKEKTDTSKIKKFFGFTLYAKKTSGDSCKKKYFGGFIRIKQEEKYTKAYILGIVVFYKRNLSYEIKKQLEATSNRIIDQMLRRVERIITTAFLHQKTFGEFRNKHEGQAVTIIGGGPTVSFFLPIKNSIYVGLNRAFLFNKIHFDYLFSIDKAGLDTGFEKYYDDFLAYDCIKFIGDQNFGPKYQIPQSFGNNDTRVRRYKTTAGGLPAQFALDLDTMPLLNSSSVSIQAMQFILFTNPKKIYVVGIDVTVSKEQHFIGSSFQNTLRGENAKLIDDIAKRDWFKLKQFAEMYYPETEIISVNPIGLKGLFRDVYTKEFLKKHPEINENEVEILTEEGGIQ